MSEETRVKRALATGNFKLTVHASKRMEERNVRAADIIECGKTARKIDYQGDGKYKVIGSDLDGDNLSVVCAFDGDVLIITVF